MTFTINGLVYETINNDTEVMLKKADGLKRPVRNIPAEVEYSGKKYKVTEVFGGNSSYDCAFKGDDILTNLSLPETIIKIQDSDFYSSYGAFNTCKKLKEINLPNSLTYIGDDAFYACSAIEQLYFGDNLEVIGNYAFNKCAALKSVDFGEKLKTIQSGAFHDCTSLQNIAFPESLENIDDWAFKGCKAMTEVNIPASVKAIGSGAFEESGVKVVNIYSENINIAENAFPTDAQINFLDANSFPKHTRKARAAKEVEAPKPTPAPKPEPKVETKPEPKPEPKAEPAKAAEQPAGDGRAYWVQAINEDNMKFVDAIFAALVSATGCNFAPNYTQSYIGATLNGRNSHLLNVKQAKKGIRLSTQVKQTAEIDSILKSLSIDGEITYGSDGWYVFFVTNKADIDKLVSVLKQSAIEGGFVSATKPEPKPVEVKDEKPAKEDKEDDDVVCDRAYWVNRSSETNINLVGEVVDVLNFASNKHYDLKYNKSYINITLNGKPAGFLYFHPLRSDLKIHIYVAQTAAFDKILADKFASDFVYEEKKYIIHIQLEDIEKKEGFFKKLFGKDGSNIEALKPILLQAEKENNQ